MYWIHFASFLCQVILEWPQTDVCYLSQADFTAFAWIYPGYSYLFCMNEILRCWVFLFQQCLR